MASSMFHIKINSPEENKDYGFFTLITSGTSIICLEDEEYIINKEVLDKLRIEDIKYELIKKLSS